MLKTRIFTAIILIPLVISAILFLEHRYFAALVGVMLLIGAWEWAPIAGWDSNLQRSLFVVLTALVLTVLGYFIHRSDAVLMGTLLVALTWWIADIAWVVRANIKGVQAVAPTQMSTPRWAKLLVGWLILCGLFAALVGLRQSEQHGPYFVIFLLVLMWVADSGAYFIGRKWGKHKLAANVSPGKSWEGVMGALIGTVVASVIAGMLFDFTLLEQFGLLAVCLITVAFSILGDLTESLFKRQAHLKDSGRILPGHGGMLDRIDSLTAAAPVFLTGLMLTGLP